jgi:acetolactate synthase regulatory subunit
VHTCKCASRESQLEIQVRRIARLLKRVLADVVIRQRTFALLKVNQICNQVDEPFCIRMHSQKAMCVTS